MDGHDQPPVAIGEASVDLRSRLCSMRSEIVEKLSQQFDGSFLALLSSIQGSIAAIDAIEGDT